MRAGRLRRNISKMAQRYYEPIKLFRSQGGGYDRDSMRFKSKGRKVKNIKMAIFKNSGANNSIKRASSLQHEGNMIEYDVKFYTSQKIKFTEDSEDQSDVFEWQGKQYIVIFLDERTEDCNLTIGYASIYKGICCEK